MRTVKKDGNMPRVLVRIHGTDRHENKTEKIITATDGRQFKLYLAPLSEDTMLRKEELAVQVGEVIGIGPGCEGYEVGDTVLMDYNVDSDEQYQVSMKGIDGYELQPGDKIVSVPCKTTYHETSFSITSYGLQRGPNEFVYTGERNMLIWDAGDVNDLGLVYGIIRQTPEGPQLIPADYWIFCEHQPERSETMEAVNGILAYQQYDDTFVKRKVLFCGENSDFQAGDTVLAVQGAAIPLLVDDVKFDVIARTDVFAVEEETAVTAI